MTSDSAECSLASFAAMSLFLSTMDSQDVTLKLPSEVWQLIAKSFLNFKSIVQLSQASKFLKGTLDDETLWRFIFIRFLRSSGCPVELIPAFTSRLDHLKKSRELFIRSYQGVIKSSTSILPLPERSIPWLDMSWGPQHGALWQQDTDPDAFQGLALHLVQRLWFLSVTATTKIKRSGTYTAVFRIKVDEVVLYPLNIDVKQDGVSVYSRQIPALYGREGQPWFYLVANNIDLTVDSSKANEIRITFSEIHAMKGGYWVDIALLLPTELLEDVIPAPSAVTARLQIGF